MKRLYPQVYDGDWVYPRRKNYRMKCCDCGLVHRLNLKLVKRGSGRAILMQVFRDERATAAVRRKRQKVKVT